QPYLDVLDLLTFASVEVDIPPDTGTVRVRTGGATGLRGEVHGLVEDLADLRTGHLQVHHHVAEGQQRVGVGDGEVTRFDDFTHATGVLDGDIGVEAPHPERLGDQLLGIATVVGSVAIGTIRRRDAIVLAGAAFQTQR